MIIYKVTNKVNGKIYIGQTIKTLHERKVRHFNWMSYKPYYFHEALNKYGEDNFTWEVLCECDTQDELNEMEFHYIKQYNCLSPNGYNLKEGGVTSPMINPSKDVKENHRKGCLRAMSGFTGDNNVMKRPDVIEKHKQAVNEPLKCKKQSEWMKKNNPSFNPETNMKKTKYQVTLISPDNTIVHIDNLKQWCRDNNMNYGSLRQYIKKGCSRYKDWQISKVVRN